MLRTFDVIIFGTLFCTLQVVVDTVPAQGISTIQSATGRPFVTGVIPVVGPNGSVGGVLVDRDGIVSKARPSDRVIEPKESFRSVRGKDRRFDPSVESERRVISLRKFDASIDQTLKENAQLDLDQALLAGMRRVDYVIADLENHDVLLAGPAGDWKANASGQVLSTVDGSPVLRLDDLLDSFRAPYQFEREPISCSIEPTDEGLQRYTKLRSRIRSYSERSVRLLEKSLGDQNVLLRGIDPQSHFAHVLLAADVMMKQLAMGNENRLVHDMPSYMELLANDPSNPKILSPRWWMKPEYSPLEHSADRLTWRLPRAEILTFTQDNRPDSLAQRWADSMSQNFDRLEKKAVIFAEMRNCFDLAVVGTLIANEGLLVQSDCELTTLFDADRLMGQRFGSPKTISSEVSSARGERGWLVGISGGVTLNPSSIVKNTVEADLGIIPIDSSNDHWWWDIPQER